MNIYLSTFLYNCHFGRSNFKRVGEVFVCSYYSSPTQCCWGSVEHHLSPHRCCWYESEQMFYQLREHLVVIACQIRTIRWIAVHSLLWAFMETIFRTLSDIAAFHSKPINWYSEKAQETECGNHPVWSSDFHAVFAQPFDCLVRNWWSSASFFAMNSGTTICKLVEVFDTHARLAIHFRILTINFNHFNVFCLIKPNNYVKFICDSGVNRELHQIRQSNQFACVPSALEPLLPRLLSYINCIMYGTNKYICILNICLFLLIKLVHV